MVKIDLMFLARFLAIIQRNDVCNLIVHSQLALLCGFLKSNCA